MPNLQRRQSAKVCCLSSLLVYVMLTTQGEFIPIEGQWPVDPQEDVEVSQDRIWVDGCFDFAHHGTP